MLIFPQGFLGNQGMAPFLPLLPDPRGGVVGFALRGHAAGRDESVRNFGLTTVFAHVTVALLPHFCCKQSAQAGVAMPCVAMCALPLATQLPCALPCGAKVLSADLPASLRFAMRVREDDLPLTPAGGRPATDTMDREQGGSILRPGGGHI